LLNNKKSFSFYSPELNQHKKELILKKAEELRDFRNQISQEVCLDLTKFEKMSRFDFIKYFRIRLPNSSGQDISKAIDGVFISYQNKIKAFQQKIQFKIQKALDIRYYKIKNTKKNKVRGDVLSFSIKLGSTKLTKVVTYLTRYYNETTLGWLKENKDVDEKKKQLRNDAYNLLVKYDQRVIKLIKSRRQRVLNKLTEHPMEFKSLSFRSNNQIKTPLLNRNKNKHSKYNSFITIGAQKTVDGKIHIPVKFSDKHHGKVSEYETKPDKIGCITTPYIVSFPANGSIRIVLTKDCPNESIIDKHNYMGVDVNIKHNLFSTCNGTDIDYDRIIFNDYIKFLKKLDKKKLNKEKYKQGRDLSRNDQIKFDKWIVRVKDMLKRKSNELVKEAIKQNKDHIVMEDLQQMGKLYSRSKEFEGFKYSRLIRLLNLTDLKNIVTSIANKHGLQVSFVQPHYTSQTCNECGCIDRSNRVTQETFSCVDCGSCGNADTHSAINIRDRLESFKLRSSLLNMKNGLYSPKILKKDTIKFILYNHYSSI